MESYDPARNIAEEIEKKEKEKNNKELEDSIRQLNRKAAGDLLVGIQEMIPFRR